MKVLSQYIILFLIFINSQRSFGQNIIEISKPEFSKNYLETIKKTRELGSENPDQAILLLETLLDTDLKPFEEFDIYCWHLPFFYAKQKEFNKFLSLWNDAQEKKYFSKSREMRENRSV